MYGRSNPFLCFKTAYVKDEDDKNDKDDKLDEHEVSHHHISYRFSGSNVSVHVKPASDKQEESSAHDNPISISDENEAVSHHPISSWRRQNLTYSSVSSLL